MGDIVRIDTTAVGEFFAGAACAFGVFDGFHLGHRMMIDEVLRSAGADTKTVAITFDIDPDEVFAPTKLKKLMTNEQRLAALAASEVDEVAVLPFSLAFAAQSPVDFLENLFGQGAPSVIHVGADFGFGKYGAGKVADMKAWGEPHGMQVVGHELLALDGASITATRIRGLLAEGDIREATKLLGHPYVFSGEVVHGRGSGREFGIPTANLAAPENRFCVGDGVYGCRVPISGKYYNAAVCIGIPPTFAQAAKQQVEVHVIDFDGDLYGETLEVEFVQFIRPNRVFSGVEELVATLQDNIKTITETQPL